MTRKLLVAIGVSVLAAGVAGCGGSATPPTTPVAAVPASVSTAASAPTAAPVATAAAAPQAAVPAGPAAGWVMPDLVGSNLQEAQDAIQRLTDFGIAVTTSHDATGAGRHQVLDRNWKVCSQSVAAGQPITGSSLIDFGAVKLGEPC